MYHGKHEIKKSNRKRSLRFRRKPVLMLLSLLLVLGMAVGGTVAYLYVTDDPIKNTFTPNQAPNQVVETFDGTTKKDVKIKNTSDIDTYIRAAVLVNWEDEQGNVYGTAPVADRDYTITWSGTDENGGWEQGSDGYYYYKSKVSANNETSILFTDCKLAENENAPAGYYLSVEIVAQSIQADGTDASGNHPATLAWGATVNNDGTISAPKSDD